MGVHEPASSGQRPYLRLKKSLEALLGKAPLEQLTMVLLRASARGQISYAEVKNLAGTEADEVMLLAVDLRLLVPVRSANDSYNWSDALLRCQPGEIYKMPHLSRHLVLQSAATGRWDLEKAVKAVFQEMGEPEWALMPLLVRYLREKSAHHRVNAFQIETTCRNLGLGEKVGSLILELKGAGVISPRFDSFSEVRRSESPVYEINKALFLCPITL